MSEIGKGTTPAPRSAVQSTQNEREIPLRDELLEKPERSDERTLDGLDEARAKMNQTAEKARPTKVRRALGYFGNFFLGLFVLFCVVFALLTVMVATVTYLTATDYKTTDTRSCQIDVGDRIVTGHRTYEYPFKVIHLLGAKKVVNVNEVVETTYMKLDGKPLMVLGQTAGAAPTDGKNWWAETPDLGDFGEITLKPADQYYFIDGKKIQLVSYRAFCK